MPTTCIKTLVEPNNNVKSLVINHRAYASIDPPEIYTCITDGWTRAHFVTVNAPVNNTKIAEVLKSIYNTNGAIMYSTHTAEIDVPHLPQFACCSYIVFDLSAFSLIDIGQLYDAHCAGLLITNSVQIENKNTAFI
jgi:hypothetical protein